MEMQDLNKVNYEQEENWKRTIVNGKNLTNDNSGKEKSEKGQF